MDKADLLHRIRTGRKRFEAALRGWSDEELVQPGTWGEWSAADLLAHIAAWERRMLRYVEGIRQGVTPELVAYGLPDATIDRLNRELYLASRGRPPAEVRAEFARSHEETLQALEAMPEADLQLTAAVEGVGVVPLWEVVSADAWRHYAEHLGSLLARPSGVQRGGPPR